MDKSALFLLTVIAVVLIFTPVVVDAPLAQEWKTDLTTAILTQVLERYPPTACTPCSGTYISYVVEYICTYVLQYTLSIVGTV